MMVFAVMEKGKNMNKIIDILGNELNVGDICAYIKAERTGSSTVRKILHTGRITSIKNGSKVIFDGETTVYVPSDIVKLENPVVHGRWVWDSTNDRYFCSRCNKEPSGDCDGGCVSHLSDYCPNCGARMDGE